MLEIIAEKNYIHLNSIDLNISFDIAICKAKNKIRRR
jgi:hypothetical protein